MRTSQRFIFGVALLAVGVFFDGVSKGDTDPFPVRTVWYSGKIGADARIQVTLNVPLPEWNGKQKITGSYFYESVGHPLQLVGDIADNAQWNLQERTAAGKCTGIFTGTFAADKDDNASLTWASPDGTRKLPVTLNRIAQETTVCFTQGARVTKCYRHPQLLSDAPLAKLVEKKLRKDTADEFASEGDFPQDAWPKAAEDRTFYRDEIQSNTTLAYFSDSLISLKVDIYRDGGGAHGNNWLAGRNFDLRDGKLRELKLAELFQPGSNYIGRLSDSCIRVLKLKQASSAVDGTLKQLDEKHLSEFVLGPKGMTFMFAPYMVGSFAEGAYEVTIPWKSVADIVARSPWMDRLLSVQLGQLFLGDWQITKVAGYARVSAMDARESARWIGVRAHYTLDSARIDYSSGSARCDNPAYAIRSMTVDEFREKYRTEPKDLGLTGDTIAYVHVSSGKTEMLPPGNEIILKSRNAIIFDWDGVYFELTRR